VILRIGWKQWREQRLPAGLLLALGVVAVVLVRPAGSGAADLPVAVFSLTFVVAAYGLVCGVLSLAADQEGQARTFLDRLAPSRLSVWFAQTLAGAALTLAHALLLAATVWVVWSGAAGPGGLSRRLWVLPLYALVAFGWGVCAAALTRTAMGAMLVGGALAAASVFAGQTLLRPTLVSEPGAAELIAGAAVAGAAVLASGLVHCWVDVLRLLQGSGPPAFLQGPRWAAARRWLWLGWRRYRAVLALLVLGLVAGVLLRPHGLLLWPVVTLAGGLVIGLGLLEKRRGEEFLLEQRLARGKEWLPGTPPRLAAAASFAALVLAGAWSQAEKVPEPRGEWLAGWPAPPAGAGHPGGMAGRLLQRALDIQEEWLAGSRQLGFPGNAGLFLTLWLLTGFCVGRLGLLCLGRRGVALGAGLPASVLLAGVWVPSLVNQGLAWCQALTPCAALLLACLLLDWGDGVLARRGKAVAAAACLGVALAWIGGVLWHRATEIADAGEPFDVAAFTGTLVPPERDRVAQRLVEAARDFRLQSIRVTRRLGRPEATPAPRDLPMFPLGGPADRTQELLRSDRFQDWRTLYQLQLDEVSAAGWPDRSARLRRWVEGVCEGRWMQHLEALGQLSGGPGALPGDWAGGTDTYTYEVDGQTLRASYYDDSRQMTKVLHARALLLEGRGQLSAALGCYRAILALSRHLCGRGMTLDRLVGMGLESVACRDLEGWAGAVREEGLLIQALRAADEQEEAAAPLLDLVRCEYLVHVRRPLSAATYLSDRPGVEGWKRGLYRLARLAPWERERERRYLNRAYRKLVEEARQPTREEAPRPGVRGRAHPVEQLTLSLGSLRTAHCRRLCRLRGLRLQLASAAYRVRNGRCPARLQELAPGLLGRLPVDPWSGEPFRYRVSAGERILIGDTSFGPYPSGWHQLLAVMDLFRWRPLPGTPGVPWMTVVPAVRATFAGFDPGAPAVVPGTPPGVEVPGAPRRTDPVLEVEPHRWVAPGRGVIWSVGEDRRDDGGTDERRDSIFLVPLAAK
jgi:hypothetical protein